MTRRPLDGTLARRRLAAILVLSLLVVPTALHPSGSASWLVPAAAVLAGAALVSVLLPWRHLPAAAHTVPPALVLLAMVLLRQTHTGTGGYLLAALLPVLWLAVHVGARPAAVAVVLCTLGFAVPELVRGGADGSAVTTLRSAVAFAVVATVLAWLAGELGAERDRHSGQALDAAVRAVSPADGAPTSGGALCDLAAQRTGAEFVVLVEEVAGELVATACSTTGAHRGGGVAVDEATSAAARAHRTGRSSWVADVDPEQVDAPLLEPTVRAVLWEPVWGSGTVRGLLGIGFHDARRQLGPAQRSAARSAATDVGWVLTTADRVSELESAASTDHLTGLPNRRWLREHAEHELRVLRSEHRGACVLMLDLDRFKAYNDTHGHAAGDEVLRRFAAAARGVLRGTEVLGRWGGEEFVVFLPGADTRSAVAVAHRLQAAVPDGQTCSVGVAGWDGGEPLGPVLARADAAMYRAKRRGRDRVVVDGAEREQVAELDVRRAV